MTPHGGADGLVRSLPTASFAWLAPAALMGVGGALQCVGAYALVSTFGVTTTAAIYGLGGLAAWLRSFVIRRSLPC